MNQNLTWSTKNLLDQERLRKHQDDGKTAFRHWEVFRSTRRRGERPSRRSDPGWQWCRDLQRPNKNLIIIFIAFLFLCIFIFSSVCLSVFLSFCPSVSLSLCLSVVVPFCLSVVVPFCLSFFLSFCLSVFLSFCLSALCLSVSTSFRLSVSPSNLSFLIPF